MNTLIVLLTFLQNETYYGALYDVITQHNLDGLDLDIEEAVDITCALNLLSRLDANFGSKFLLTMAPVASTMIPGGPGLSGFNYVDLDGNATSHTRSNGKLVDWYNVQFYNGSSSAGTSVATLPMLTVLSSESLMFSCSPISTTMIKSTASVH
jgi:chitinase